ncbi:MAG: ACT domain-containing protein [Pseudomonadota bacterium]
MLSYIVVSLLGPDRPGIVFEVSRLADDCGCQIQDSRMAVLAGEFAAQMLVCGKWSAIAKLESSLPRTSAELGLELTIHRTEPRTDTDRLIPYSVEVLSLTRPGVVRDVAEFFSRRDINVEDLFTSCYAAAHTQAPMYSLHMTVGVPADLAIATLRNEFLELCDELNLDAVMTAFK